MALFDITPRIDHSLTVWPGDSPLAREVLLDIERGDTVTLSTLRATVHLGAHADAPNHYARAGVSIEARPIELYLGPCRVIRVDVARAARVSLAEFERGAAAAHLSGPLPPRVLLATGTFPDPTRWNDDFAALSPELVDGLASRGVRLIGVDTPSVDLMEDKRLLAHQRFFAHDMAILEGLLLRAVPPGDYELIALPLPLAGFDASPVRAVLRG